MRVANCWYLHYSHVGKSATPQVRKRTNVCGWSGCDGENQLHLQRYASGCGTYRTRMDDIRFSRVSGFPPRTLLPSFRGHPLKWPGRQENYRKHLQDRPEPQGPRVCRPGTPQSGPLRRSDAPSIQKHSWRPVSESMATGRNKQ